MRKFHLQLVLVAAMVSCLLCCYLAPKPQLLLLGIGPEREASLRPHGNEANLLQKPYKCSGWGKKNCMGCFVFPNWSYLFCESGMPSYLQTPVLPFPWFSQSWGGVGMSGRTVVQKVGWESMQFCFHTLDLP